jgi:hypothetical protein
MSFSFMLSGNNSSDNFQKRFKYKKRRHEDNGREKGENICNLNSSSSSC